MRRQRNRRGGTGARRKQAPPKGPTSTTTERQAIRTLGKRKDIAGVKAEHVLVVRSLIRGLWYNDELAREVIELARKCHDKTGG